MKVTISTALSQDYLQPQGPLGESCGGLPKGFRVYASPCSLMVLPLPPAPVLTLTLVPGQSQSPHLSLSKQA